MNFRLIANTTSYVLWVEAGFLLLPLLVSVLYDEPWMPFFATAVLCILIGFILQLVPVKKAQMHSRDGFMAVALGWIALSLSGALPYVFSGALTEYEDAIFETVSGLTTTGSTVFPEVEHLYRSVLLWRSLTQWMGGMGVLVLFLALMPKLGDGAVYLMRAESPGPIKSKLVPKVGSTAKILYTIYLALTAMEMLCLRLAGLTWFSAVNHAFTTMATGGFSINNTSLSGSSPAVMWIVTIFSFLAGVNFSLLFLAVTGKLRAALHSEELRVYTAVVVGMTLLICLCLRLQAGIPLSGSITDAAFQTVTIITTTPGFCHGGLCHVAHLLPYGAAGADVLRRLCRLHRRRHEGVPRADPVEVAGARAEADGTSQPRQRHQGGRSAGGGAGGVVHRRLYHGVYGGAADRRAGGELGQLRLSGVLCRVPDLHQQRGAGSGHSGTHGKLLHPLTAEQGGSVAGDADGPSGADAYAGAAEPRCVA